MTELYTLRRTDTNQYYYSLIPRGYPLWIDSSEHAQLLREEEADNLLSFLRYSPYKNVLVIESA